MCVSDLSGVGCGGRGRGITRQARGQTETEGSRTMGAAVKEDPHAKRPRQAHVKWQAQMAKRAKERPKKGGESGAFPAGQARAGERKRKERGR